MTRVRRAQRISQEPTLTQAGALQRAVSESHLVLTCCSFPASPPPPPEFREAPPHFLMVLWDFCCRKVQTRWCGFHPESVVLQAVRWASWFSGSLR